ncbi:MAG: hypothetical protein AAF740_03210, partial [Bacteroidota bacterium]
MHLHTINSNSELLAQERHDPITGEALKAGDEIVLCAGCKSAFLKDTWLYLEEEHCGQNETLAEFPRQEELEIALREVEIRDFKLENLKFYVGTGFETEEEQKHSVESSP